MIAYQVYRYYKLFTFDYEDLVKKHFGIVNVRVCYYIHYFET